jgi:hypothetical protein
VTSIGFFSTDFSSEPVVDETQSRIQGKQVFVPGQQRISFGGTFLQRGAMPAMELNKHGYDNHLAWRFEVAPDGHIRTLDLEGNWHDPDWIYTQRWMHKDGVEQMRRARAAGQRCLADLDDAFHSLPKSNIAHSTTDAKNNPDFNRDHYWKMLAECDFVTVSTEPLRKEMERLGVPAFTVRNAIQLERWPQLDPAEDEKFISWIGGIQWRAHDLQILRSVGLPQFLKGTGQGMYHGGESQVPGVPKFWELIGIDPKETPCASAPLSHIAAYPQLWGPVAVMLIPLERCRFNEAKSYLKGLEACAAGVPYIVSAGFPEHQILINEGSAGRVARNDKPSSWIGHLEELLDPEVRRAEGKINRSIAERHDITDRWVDWDVVYKQFIK